MSDITLSDPEVSRYHAQMVQTDAGYQIQDMGSTNGTYVDDQRLTSEPVPLSPGQTIMLGSGVTLEYEAVGQDEAEMATIVERSPLSRTSQPSAGSEPAESPKSPELPPLPDFDDEYIAPGAAPISTRRPPAEPPPPSSPFVPADDNDGRRRRNTIIAVIIIVLVCCCCAFLVSGYYYWGDLLLDWLREQGMTGF